jgi:uncharacterized membrane protein YqjE
VWPLLRDVLRELLQLGLCAAGQQAQAWRDACVQALVRERQRLFEGLALLCLGLVLFTLGLAGLLLVLWWVLPEPARLVAMGVLTATLMMLGLAVLGLAWRRWQPPA